VQYIATINTSPLIVLERPSIRLGDVTADADESVDVTIPQGQLMDAAASGEETFKRTTISDVSRYQHHVSGEATFDMHLNVRLEGKVKNTVVTLVYSGGYR
jgi:hypothetical protein